MTVITISLFPYAYDECTYVRILYLRVYSIMIIVSMRFLLSYFIAAVSQSRAMNIKKSYTRVRVLLQVLVIIYYIVKYLNCTYNIAGVVKF